MTRATKIVATLGPASNTPEVLEQMIRAGVDVVRLNFSHGNHETHAESYRRIRDAARQAGRHVAIMQDLSGPKIRTGPLSGGVAIPLKPGDELRIAEGDAPGGPGLVAFLRILAFAHDPRVRDAALVSVLAYAWGTHSGWVEACRDVGTWALAPAVGFLAEQGGVLTWGPPEVPASVARIVELLGEAAAPPPRVSRAEREAERDLVATRHAEVYAAVLAGERVDASTVGGEVA